MRWWLLFAIVLGFHWTIQFVLWAYADADDAFFVYFHIVSAPVIALFPNLALTLFWPLTVANSAVWAVAVVLVGRTVRGWRLCPASKPANKN